MRYCICCKHCPDNYKGKFDVGECKIDGGDDTISIDDLFNPHEEEFVLGTCEQYEPRPEPELSHCKAVLKMLGLEVG